MGEVDRHDPEKERAKRYNLVAKLLASYPQTAERSADFVKSFHDALAGISTPVLIEVVDRFVKGMVVDRNNAFAPSTAEIHQEADEVAERQRIDWRQETLRREGIVVDGKLPEPHHHSEDSKIRVQKMVDEFKADRTKEDEKAKRDRLRKQHEQIMVALEDNVAKSGQLATDPDQVKEALRNLREQGQ